MTQILGKCGTELNIQHEVDSCSSQLSSEDSCLWKAISRCKSCHLFPGSKSKAWFVMETWHEAESPGRNTRGRGDYRGNGKPLAFVHIHFLLNLIQPSPTTSLLCSAPTAATSGPQSQESTWVHYVHDFRDYLVCKPAPSSSFPLFLHTHSITGCCPSSTQTIKTALLLAGARGCPLLSCPGLLHSSFFAVHVFHLTEWNHHMGQFQI